MINFSLCVQDVPELCNFPIKTKSKHISCSYFLAAGFLPIQMNAETLSHRVRACTADKI